MSSLNPKMAKRPGYVTLQTRIPPDMLEQLRAHADADERTVGGAVRWMLRTPPKTKDMEFESPPAYWAKVNIELKPEQADAIRAAAEKASDEVRDYISVAAWLYAVIKRGLQKKTPA